MTVDEICSHEVYVVKASQTLAEVAREMQKHHVEVLVVVDSKKDPLRPVGIVTVGDIVRGSLARGTDLNNLKVGDVMSGDLLTVFEQTDPSTAIESMQCRMVRRAPVVNAAGELIGIVSLDDLLLAVTSDADAFAELADR